MKRNWTSREKKVWLLSSILIALIGSVVFALVKDNDKMGRLELELVLEDIEQEELSEQNDTVVMREIVEEEVEYYVDVKGAVRQPGVYRLAEGDRVMDALEQAGQVREDGTTDHINLAQKVYDGMVIYIPTLDEVDQGQLQSTLTSQVTTNEGVHGAASNSPSNKININSASAEELQKLPGVGASRAQAIIDYRTEKGLFQSPEDLKNISGIGPKIFERLKELIEI